MIQHLRTVRTLGSWEEQTTQEAGSGHKITRVRATYALAGAIEGDAILDYSMVYLSSAKAMFLGYEQVHGAIGNRSGTFVLRHQGTFDGGAVMIDVQVVPGAGTEGLTGVSGQGRIIADSTDPVKATLELDVELP